MIAELRVRHRLQAKQALQDLLDNDPFLRERAGPVEITVMQKSAFSVFR